MLFPFLLFIFSFIGLAVATYTDLKQRIIANKLNYALIFAGLLLHGIKAAVENNAWIFVTAAAVTIAAFAGAYFLWKLGVWAGGDVKLMTGLAALNPFNPNILQSVFGVKIALFSSISMPVFPLTLFIFSLFAMLPYGVLIGARGLMKRKDLQAEIKKDFKKNIASTIIFSLAIAGVGVMLPKILPQFGFALWLVLPVAVLFGFVPKKAKAPAAAVLFALALIYDAKEAFVELAYLFAFFVLAYFALKLFFLSRKVLRETKRISELQEGDIPAESIYLQDGTVVRAEKIEMKSILSYLRNNKLAELQDYFFPKGTEIISSKKARGVIQEEIKALQELVKEKKLEDRIELKLSAPFVPAILIAYILLNIVGDLLWNLVIK